MVPFEEFIYMVIMKGTVSEGEEGKKNSLSKRGDLIRGS